MDQVSVELIIAVCSALTTFGIGYNTLVGWLERKAPGHGYTAFLVVGGVLVTLAGATFIIGWQAVLLVGLCFVASGLPMIAGSIWRYIRRQMSERERIFDGAMEVLRGGP